MMNENSILGNQLVVMSRADLDALVEKMASSMAATRVEVEDKAVHGNGVCPVVFDDERFITREETAKLLHVDYSTLWRWNKLGLLCPNKVGPRRVMYKYSDVLKKLNGEGQQKEEQKGEDDAAIDYLSDDDAGQLFKAIYAYADEGDMPDFNGPMMSLFMVICTQIDRSREAYKAKCEKNRTNSMKRKTMQGNSMATSMDNERKPSLSTDNDRCPPTTTVTLPNPNPSPSPIPNPDIDDGVDTHIINEAEVAVSEECPFNEIWDMYGKPVGDVEQLRKRWQQLTLDEKRKIYEYVPLYVQSRPEKKYRKDFANFLTCRTWETEPLTKESLSNGSFNLHSTPTNETRRAVALQNTKQLVSQFLAVNNEPAVSFGEGEE